MAAHFDDINGLVISEDDARGGVTGHNVRYVLAYGMTGVIAMFAAVAIYNGFDRLKNNLSAALSRSPSEILQAFAPYAAIVLAGAIGVALLLGVWNLLSGRSENGTQRFMRFRVAAQLATICVIMAMLYVSAV
jgi:uncharacterized membrane protein SpoIIM required for sporulation